MKGKPMFPFADLHSLRHMPRYPAGLSPADDHSFHARAILTRERAERLSASRARARARRHAAVTLCKAVAARVLRPLRNTL